METNYNTSLHLTQREYFFILNMAKRGANDGVTELSKGAVLRAMVRLLQQLRVDVSGVRTEDQLLERLQNAVQVN